MAYSLCHSDTVGPDLVSNSKQRLNSLASTRALVSISQSQASPKHEHNAARPRGARPCAPGHSPWPRTVVYAAWHLPGAIGCSPDAPSHGVTGRWTPVVPALYRTVRYRAGTRSVPQSPPGSTSLEKRHALSIAVDSVFPNQILDVHVNLDSCKHDILSRPTGEPRTSARALV